MRELLTERRNVLGLSHAEAAAFIGVTKPTYWDLESSDYEYECIDVIQLVRMAALFRISFGELLKGIIPDSHQNCADSISIPFDLEEIFPDRKARVDKAGWEWTAPEIWFESLQSFSDMPLTALIAVCSEYDISALLFLNNYSTLLEVIRKI